MGEGVAEVEQGALAVLALVAHDHTGLGPAADRHRLVALGAAREEAGPVRFAPVEEARIRDEPVLRDFRVARPHLALREGVEGGGVGDDKARLVEGADQVLAVGGVDPGLAAHRGIDLGEQGGRRLHEAHAPAQGRGGEAREITHDSAAERHHDVVALDLVGQQAIADLRVGGVALRGFARRHRHDPGAQARRVQARAQTLAVEAGHGLVGDDHRRAGAETGHGGAGRVENVAADADVVVAARVERHVNGQGRTHCAATPWFEEPLRWASSASITSCTTRSCETSREGTTTSATS